jgi:hypothetical protein
MRPLFHKITLVLVARKHLTISEGIALMRTMQAYMDARQTGDLYPLLPKRIAKKALPSLVYALFRVSFDEPWGLIGILCIPVAIPLLIYLHGQRLLHAVNIL